MLSPPTPPLSSDRCPVLYQAYIDPDTDILNLYLEQNSNAMSHIF